MKHTPTEITSKESVSFWHNQQMCGSLECGGSAEKVVAPSPAPDGVKPRCDRTSFRRTRRKQSQMQLFEVIVFLSLILSKAV